MHWRRFQNFANLNYGKIPFASLTDSELYVHGIITSSLTFYYYAMHLSILSLVFNLTTLVFILSQAVAIAADTCHLPPHAGTFSSSLYSALLVSAYPNSSLALSGGEAALRLYLVVKADLEGFGLCGAEVVAFAAGKGAANAGTLTLAEYFSQASAAIGERLYRNGLLNCNNVVSTSLNQYAYIERALEGLDRSKFESQFQGVVHGTHQFYVDLGLDLRDLQDFKSTQFKDADKCKTASNERYL